MKNPTPPSLTCDYRVLCFSQSFGGGPPHPPATFGRCSCCLKLWQTNSPTDAAALQSGSWICPACQAGTRSGPVPPYWEDDNVRSERIPVVVFYSLFTCNALVTLCPVQYPFPTMFLVNGG